MTGVIVCFIVLCIVLIVLTYALDMRDAITRRALCAQLRHERRLKLNKAMQ